MGAAPHLPPAVPACAIPRRGRSFRRLAAIRLISLETDTECRASFAVERRSRYNLSSVSGVTCKR
jgi:hypothetical protein